MDKRLFTLESVTEGYRDKICDNISECHFGCINGTGSNEPCGM